MENRNFGAKVNVYCIKANCARISNPAFSSSFVGCILQASFYFHLSFNHKNRKIFSHHIIKIKLLQSCVDSSFVVTISFLVSFLSFFSFEIHCTRRLALYNKIKIMLYKNIAASSVMFIRDNGDRMTGERNNAKMKDRSRKKICNDTHLKHVNTQRKLTARTLHLVNN